MPPFPLLGGNNRKTLKPIEEKVRAVLERMKMPEMTIWCYILHFVMPV